jgi:ribosomally synthesized peptide (two-chain TOMM family)
MDQDSTLPSYNDFLQYRAVIVQAIAVAWHDPQFLDRLLADPKKALHERFGYDYPMHMTLKVHADSATWTPTSNGGWTTSQVNTLELVLPPAPPSDQVAVALAAYNAKHIDFLDGQQGV